MSKSIKLTVMSGEGIGGGARRDEEHRDVVSEDGLEGVDGPGGVWVVAIAVIV